MKNILLIILIISLSGLVGHTGIVIDKYDSEYTNKFIVGATANNNGSIIYDSYTTHLNGNSHLGHFRAVRIL